MMVHLLTGKHAVESFQYHCPASGAGGPNDTLRTQQAGTRPRRAEPQRPGTLQKQRVPRNLSPAATRIAGALESRRRNVERVLVDYEVRRYSLRFSPHGDVHLE